MEDDVRLIVEDLLQVMPLWPFTVEGLFDKLYEGETRDKAYAHLDEVKAALFRHDFIEVTGDDKLMVTEKGRWLLFIGSQKRYISKIEDRREQERQRLQAERESNAKH